MSNVRVFVRGNTYKQYTYFVNIMLTCTSLDLAFSYNVTYIKIITKLIHMFSYIISDGNTTLLFIFNSYNMI